MTASTGDSDLLAATPGPHRVQAERGPDEIGRSTRPGAVQPARSSRQQPSAKVEEGIPPRGRRQRQLRTAGRSLGRSQQKVLDAVAAAGDAGLCAAEVAGKTGIASTNSPRILNAWLTGSWSSTATRRLRSGLCLRRPNGRACPPLPRGHVFHGRPSPCCAARLRCAWSSPPRYPSQVRAGTGATVSGAGGSGADRAPG